MRYFTIMYELRGCYADNESACSASFKTRKELKEFLLNESRDYIEAGSVGLSKRNIASFAAMVWRNKSNKSIYPFVLPWHYSHQSGNAMGLFAYPLARREYLDIKAYAKITAERA